jgi:hypothetical protein
MTPLFKKLNFKGHKAILAIGYPKSFEAELSAMKDFVHIVTDETKITEVEFAICFVTTKAQIDEYAYAVMSKFKGDAILWFCYPKGSSKRYICEFNRDTGWDGLGKYNLEPVRQVAIDDDWSAIRFRRVEFIKTITRAQSGALTDEARRRTSQKGK